MRQVFKIFNLFFLYPIRRNDLQEGYGGKYMKLLLPDVKKYFLIKCKFYFRLEIRNKLRHFFKYFAQF